ncbi:Nup133 N terminal like-domain-containing protein [Mycotypha africana]|uniref:Nup133 N terminal like-domain-containing protein n=1 Tax=Mycotypha africana TaxID=64632 RepID=UPI00230053D8|nr:Nup133 N terminal like-domain-containing protein [Mycotypha africana]KAI8973471.1 Nup133 N terminal like-domain-containing protein [Mycotypha africana]
MQKSSPEKIIKITREASATLDSRGLIDRQFPDLHKTFTDPPIYETTQAEAVRPVVLKKNITFPADALTNIKDYKTDSPCGVAPAINRAYFVVGKQLYLWDYIKGSIVTYEEDFDIVGIGFVKPKPDVFLDEVKQLMIISTKREVKIMALVYSSTTDLKVYPTDMKTNTTGISMTDIVGTKYGRVFMLGNDGNVWELDYRSEESWFYSKCSKKLHTSANNFTFLFGRLGDPIIQIAVSEDGKVLYQLTERSAIYVTYLGDDKKQTFINVYKKTDILEDARRTNPSSNYLNIKNCRVASIHPVSPSESTVYQLVAVTTTGCRLYYTHYRDMHQIAANDRPNNLLTLHVRPPSEDVHANDYLRNTTYHDGLLFFTKRRGLNAAQEDIITFSPDLGNLSNITHAQADNRLVEFRNVIPIQGEVFKIVEVPATDPHQLNETSILYNPPARHFLALTSYGLFVLVKQRPVDMLYQLLLPTGRDINTRLVDFESFFNHFGYVNVSALCYNLICAYISTFTSDKELVYSSEPVSESVEQGAQALLERFGQVPSSSSNSNAIYTSRHDGLALFIYRVINRIWTKQFVKQSTDEDGKKQYLCSISIQQLKKIQRVLRKLASFMDRNRELFPRAAPVNDEQKSYAELYNFIVYFSETILFLEYLMENGFSSIIQLMKPDAQQRIQQITLKDLLTTTDGQLLASELASALINFTFKKCDNVNYVTDVLTQYCGTFCGASDVLLYKAVDQIYAARNAANANQVRTLLTESLNHLMKIALHIPADKASEIASEFASQGYPVYGIRVAVECAKARDSNNASTMHAKPASKDSRSQIITSKQPFYDIIINILTSTASKGGYRKEIFDTAFSFNDKAFQHYAFEKFIEMNRGQELIKESPPNLEEFLKEAPTSYARLQVLADFYRINERYEEAAQTYKTLARTPGDISIDVRIDHLITASVCANSVTAPTKQYDMYRLKQSIEELLELARQEKLKTTTVK